MLKIFKKIKSVGFRIICSVLYVNSQKFFCIGNNKTGTTSMAELFRQIGLRVGPQRPAELLLKDWIRGDYRRIIRYVKYNGEAFQDIPFSLPNTFKIMDKEFPDSKFILTIRNSPDEWYISLTSFHSKLFGNGQIPTKEQLQIAEYVYPGWMWERTQIWETPENDIYNKEIMKKKYIDYNSSVIDYFKDRPGKLLVINVQEPDAAIKVCNFIGSEKIIHKMPWKNKS
ncbi:MAG: hypothetical protein KKG99_09360 [Bacteroidetes bacterium]|nr:hypothetical protein [Bacteroidota bacterium]